jgi:predicted dehydrogenase
MTKINILLIGLGYHARRIYVPHFIPGNNYANLSAVLDLESQKDVIEKYLQEKRFLTSTYYSKENRIADALTEDEISTLTSIVDRHNIQAVIISTEPLAHFKYARWAISHNLHVLMDKPITTEVDVSIDPAKALKLFNDYKLLEKLYIPKSKKLIFTLMAQRRFHEGYIKVKEKIIEMVHMSNCPVTSVQSFHSDGQWRFPKEIVEQTAHPYNQGYGKMSHSGYHSLDTCIWFASAARPQTKTWNNYELYSQFIRPSDVVSQFNCEDYKQLFNHIPEEYLVNTIQMKNHHKVFGEIDAHTLLSLKKGSEILTHISCGALHNAFGQRSWITANGRDLYKGNGRIRHESYIIEQGPFQAIIINSFQSQEILKEKIASYDVGGEYHFDIHIFRNSTLFTNEKPYELITMKKLKNIKDLNYSRGHQEEARYNCIDEFLHSIISETSINEQKSNFLHHKLTTQILSSIYLSASRQFVGKNGVISQAIDYA